ncbi:MAG: BlaI/MecI/CopY family transcriptional regulator [Sphingomonadales bacterium]|nr:BlaI/MecI/CopY family transcriptional regulator [Sphingomonadales bacterium]
MAVERISESEYAVITPLWEESPLTAVEIADRVADAQGWTLQTVKTLLSRLVNKGAVAFEAQGRRYLYRPLIERDDHAVAESRRLIDRLFAGKVSPLVAHLAERDVLSKEDIAAIEALLKDLRP